MGAVRVRVALGPQPGAGILLMVGYSLAGHVVFLILTIFLPRVIPRDPPPPVLLTASIVSMDALGGGSPAPPAPKPVKAGPSPEERAEAAARKERVVKEEEPPSEEAPEPQPKPDKKTPPPPGEKPAPKKEEKKKEAPKPEPPGEERPGPERATPGPGEAGAPTAPLPEGIGLGTGGGDAAGGVPSITSASFPYQYYRTTLVNLIRSRWSRPLTPGLRESLRCAVSFIISREGSVSDVALSVSSNFPPLDESAVRAVMEASPLPPLPYQYSSSSVRAEMIFELTPD